MAMQKGNNYSGVAGPVVMFVRNGKQGVRSRPLKVKQTPGMKTNNRGFGWAASIGAKVRQGLKDFVPDIKDKPLMYALNDRIAKWLKHSYAPAGPATHGFASLEGFEINAQSLLKEKLRLHPVVDWNIAGKILIHIPAMVPTGDIAVPPTPPFHSTQNVRWDFRVVDVFLGDGKKRNKKGRVVGDPTRLDATSNATLNIPYTREPIGAQTVAIDYAVEAKHLVLVFMRLVYIDGGGEEIVDERWRCGGIVGAKF